MPKFQAMRIPHHWLYLFLLVTVGLFLYYQQAQPHLSYDFAPDFDGNDYRGAYDYFRGDVDTYKVPPPFHNRVLVPWLAAILGGGETITDFQWLNLAFALLSVFMLFQLWRSLGFELKWFLVGFGWLLFHWTGMIRLNTFDPITVDVPIFFFQALLLWIILKRKFVWLLVLGPLATLQKESFIGLLVVLTAYGLYHNKKQDDAYFEMKWIWGSLILSIATNQIFNALLPASETGRNAIITLLYHAREAVLHPFELVRWLVAAFVAFGPFLIAAVITAAQRRYYDNRRNLFLLFSLLYLAYGILAGGDMTRIIFLGFPFIMTWLMYELRELNSKRLLLLTLLALPLTALWGLIPDPAFEWEAWQGWYPEFAPVKTVLFFLAYGLVITVFLLFNKGASARAHLFKRNSTKQM